jgi:rRNA maturation protein Nop10
MAQKIYQCPFCGEYFKTLSEFLDNQDKCGKDFDAKNYPQSEVK